MDIYKFAKWIASNKTRETVIVFPTILIIAISAVGLSLWSPYYIIGLIVGGGFSAYMASSPKDKNNIYGK